MGYVSQGGQGLGVIMANRGKTIFVNLGNVVNPTMKLFKSSFPDTRAAEGTEMKAEVVSDIGDLKKLPSGYVSLEPFLDQVDVGGISTNRPGN